MVFTSRDKFQAQVAPLFMDPFQTFVHGDELQADLKRLNEMYQQLPQEELDKGLIGFAPHPPEDTTFLTTRLWDKYLPKWREPHTPLGELPKELLEAIDQLGKKAIDAAPAKDAHDVQDVDMLDFVTVSKKVSTKKGSYLRFSKETILKINEEEKQKAIEEEAAQKGTIHPAGRAFEALREEITGLTQDPKCRNLEVYFLSNKIDENGEKVVHDGMWTAEIRPITLHVVDDETWLFLRQEYDKAPVLSILLLWTRYGAGKLGIFRMKPAPKDGRPLDEEFEDWERKAISAYLHRHHL